MPSTLVHRALRAVMTTTLLLSAVSCTNCEINVVLAKRSQVAIDQMVPSSSGVAIYNEALGIFNQADLVHYEHQAAKASSQVTYKGESCDAECDCSGFVSYVLHEVTPKYYSALEDFAGRSSHPQAKDFVHFFATLSATESGEGWLAVKSYRELGRGDLIAWEKAVTVQPAGGSTKKGNTGHVMIVESPPLSAESTKVNGADVRFVGIPVIDSSSVDHFPPEQLPPLAHQQHRDGVGRGVVRLILDEQDHVVGYWEGTYWNEGGKQITKPSYTDSVVFARLRFEKP